MYGLPKSVCVVCNPSVRLDAPSICFCLCFCMSEVISPFKSLIAGSQVFALLWCFFVLFCILCSRVRACSCYAFYWYVYVDCGDDG